MLFRLKGWTISILITEQSFGMPGWWSTSLQPTQSCWWSCDQASRTLEVCETLMLADRSSWRCHCQMLLPLLPWFPFSSGECQPQEAMDPPHKEAEVMQTHNVVNHPAGFCCFFFPPQAASRVFSSALMLHTVSPSAGSRLRAVAHIVSLLSQDLTGCGSGSAWGSFWQSGVLRRSG